MIELTYRKTQFLTITVDTSSINMGTGHLVNTNPSNNTNSACDIIGCSISFNSTWSVTLMKQSMLTESPMISKLPLAPRFSLINCSRSTLKLLPTSESWIHFVLSSYKEVFLMNRSNCDRSLITDFLTEQVWDSAVPEITHDTFPKIKLITHSAATDSKADFIFVLTRPSK